MLKEPNSIEECVYFTNRILDKGKIKAWVFKKNCPNCNILMGKPKDSKGKILIRAKDYICYKCNLKETEEEYEKDLTVNIKYTCPYCNNNGELEVPFKRKKVQVLNEETGKKTTSDTIRFQCQKCNKDIDITKRMK